MPIEDVAFLKENSIKQSYIFLVNSADRDRLAYPTPSEYVVEFTTPFQNVVGMQILHASIPRTMYNVDVRNNTIAFRIYDGAQDVTTLHDSGAYVKRDLTPGDYTIQALLVELQRVLRMPVNNDPNREESAISVSTTTNSPEVQSILRFTCPHAFVFDMRASTIAETLGFDLYVDAAEAQKPLLQRRFDPKPIPSQESKPNYKIFHSVDAPANVALGEERTVFDGPRGVVRRLPLTSPVAQQFTLEAPGHLTQVFAALTTGDGTVRPGSVARWQVFRDGGNQPQGDALASGLIPVSFVDGALSDQDAPVAAPLGAGTYWLVLSRPSPDTGDDVFVFFNDVPINLRAGDLRVRAGAEWVLQDTDTGVHFEMSARIVVRDEYHTLVAPGMYSLIGERFVVLRCPEIEENSFRSLAYGRHFLGLAKFQLGVVGYSESRLDFSSIPLREFHPIGKLSRLTLRFVTASGDLYDFKGINHDITIAIHYYEVVQKNAFTRSILNPNYSGNVMQYISQRDAPEYDSDELDEEYGRDTFREFRAAEARHLPENVRRLDLEAVRQLRLTEEDVEEAEASEYSDEDP
jgi:hypothetical protein